MSIRKIYFINLDRSESRLKSVTDMIKQYFPEAEYERFKAVDGLNTDFKEYRKYFTKYCWARRFNMSGAYACYLSHIMLLEKMMNDDTLSDDDFVLILEDDAKPFENRLQKLPEALEELPENCKWLSLGLRRKKIQNKYLDNEIFSQPLAKNPFNVGAHAYVVKKCRIKELLNIHLPFKYHHIDIVNRKNFNRIGYLCLTEDIFTVVGDNSVRRNIDKKRRKQKKKKLTNDKQNLSKKKRLKNQNLSKRKKVRLRKK